MPEPPKKKLVLLATHGVESPERATLPLVVGNAALAMDEPVVLVLQSSGVTLAAKGMVEHVFAQGFDPAKKLLDSFLELGGKVLVCIPCLENRRIDDSQLVPGAEKVKVARVVTEILDAGAVLSY